MDRIHIPSPVGWLEIAATGRGIARIEILPQGEAGVMPASPWLFQAVSQFDAYFAGRRPRFDLPLDLNPTPFQRAVWDRLLAIPVGQTRTYGDIAASIGQPGAARAVGGAIKANPVPILIPCHRATAAGGKLVGFSAGEGVVTQRALQALERGWVERG
ncbi:MAG: cysteine methyltransferase [Alphaproteobacteria bacterium CG_4_10_14_0_2_um_filter_63_37]|nr:MAG: hypothetical protein AUJ55_07760 [Proteobacteria bacterium CG1_02_64_396]PJA24435.1 MAG: cysteine methyltransferase [Alphaproteobacteria bacterium CG_4_10_14_0_2_um_filter_63_37]